MRKCSFRIIRIPKGVEKENGAESVLNEIIEMKNTMGERKQNMDSLNAHVDNIEEKISIIEDRQAEWLQTEEERELRI